MSYNGISGDYTTLLGQNARACEIQGRKRGSTLRVVKVLQVPIQLQRYYFYCVRQDIIPKDHSVSSTWQSIRVDPAIAHPFHAG
jgi:hypothetical protein